MIRTSQPIPHLSIVHASESSNSCSPNPLRAPPSPTHRINDCSRDTRVICILFSISYTDQLHQRAPNPPVWYVPVIPPARWPVAGLALLVSSTGESRRCVSSPGRCFWRLIDERRFLVIPMECCWCRRLEYRLRLQLENVALYRLKLQEELVVT